MERGGISRHVHGCVETHSELRRVSLSARWIVVPVSGDELDLVDPFRSCKFQVVDLIASQRWVDRRELISAMVVGRRQGCHFRTMSLYEAISFKLGLPERVHSTGKLLVSMIFPRFLHPRLVDSIHDQPLPIDDSRLPTASDFRMLTRRTFRDSIHPVLDSRLSTPSSLLPPPP